MRPRTDIVLLDLGGVLADLGSPAARMGLDIPDAEFWELWLHSDSVRRFETGRLREPDFLDIFSKELGLSEPADLFRQRFLRWHLALFPDVVTILSTLRNSCRVALLSNTNSVHWGMVRDQAPVDDLFDRLFLSFETGLAKPDDTAFEYVLDSLGEQPGAILFLDDTQKNVDAASRFGIRSQQVRGPDGLARGLESAGVRLS